MVEDRLDSDEDAWLDEEDDEEDKDGALEDDEMEDVVDEG